MSLATAAIASSTSPVRSCAATVSAISASRRSFEPYIDAGSPAVTWDSTRVKASALRERCATTWARDQPGSTDGRPTDSSSRTVSAWR